MNRFPKGTDANANSSLIKSHLKLMKQKASSEKLKDGFATPIKEPKRKEPSAEQLIEEEKETVVQEILRYMLGHRLSVENTRLTKKNYLASTGEEEKSKTIKSIVKKQDDEPKETLVKKLLEYALEPKTSVTFTKLTYLSDALEKEHIVPSKQTGKVSVPRDEHSYETNAKLWTKKYSMDNHIHPDGRELKDVPTTTSFSNRRSRYRIRKRLPQQVQSDKIDRFIAQSHHKIKYQSSPEISVQNSLTSGTNYWPRVLVLSDLNSLFSRIRAENATM